MAGQSPDKKDVDFNLEKDTQLRSRHGKTFFVLKFCPRYQQTTIPRTAKIDKINAKGEGFDNLLSYPLVEIAHLWELLNEISGADNIRPGKHQGSAGKSS